MKHLSRVGFVSAAIVFACMTSIFTATAVRADAVAEFYKGKRLSVVIGSSVGGGYDQYARLLARYMGAHVPGDPEFMPRNMPGASGRKALDYVANVAPADGATIGIINRNALFDPLLFGDKSIDVDATRLNWIGSANSEVATCVAWHSSGITTLDDAKAKDMTIGSSGPSATNLLARIFNRIAGTKIKIIIGYPGSTEIHLAMERGEVTGRCGFGWDSIVARYSHWLEEKKINVLVQVAMKKHPQMPDVPLVLDFAKTDIERQMLMVFAMPNEMGRPFFMHGGIPGDRLKALQVAFDATMKDPKLLADAKRQNLAIDPMPGEDVAKIVRQVYATSPEAMALIHEVLQSTDGVEQRKENFYTVEVMLKSVKRKGRELEFEDKGTMARAMLTKKTKVSIDGKKAKSSGLRVGMNCAVTYEGHLTVAKSIACK